MRFILIFTLSFVSSQLFAQSNFLAVESNDNTLRLLNGSTFATQESLTMVVNGFDIDKVTGIAEIPGTNSFYAIMELTVQTPAAAPASSSVSSAGDSKHTTNLHTSDSILGGSTSRYLVRVRAQGGTGVIIGLTGEAIASLSMHPNGTLYGVSGDGSTTSDVLYTIDTNDGSLTFVMNLGNGDDGEAIGFRPDGTLFHSSGHNSACAGAGDGVCFESIDLNTLTTSNIDINSTALIDEEAQELLWSPGNNAFIWKQDHGSGPLFLVSADASSVTQVADLNFQLKGIAFTSLGTLIPPIPSLSAYALMLLIFGLLLVSFSYKRRQT